MSWERVLPNKHTTSTGRLLRHCHVLFCKKFFLWKDLFFVKSKVTECGFAEEILLFTFSYGCLLCLEIRTKRYVLLFRATGKAEWSYSNHKDTVSTGHMWSHVDTFTNKKSILFTTAVSTSCTCEEAEIEENSKTTHNHIIQSSHKNLNTLEFPAHIITWGSGTFICLCIFLFLTCTMAFGGGARALGKVKKI